ncbi:MAG TPA: 3-isopropylmalate dehydratase small subunit [Acidimicrobiales bacterium]|jgi:3-isopropylmalate/(R)-2-methylmalate dehydratase small subunit|nr:3-isopropylmalate dehydratase small subunit [Acidimicrobiales bacterium]
MEPVRIVSGRAAPLDRADVDTDQIIPSEWLKRIERTGFGAGLFAQWRDEPGFVLNRPEYQGARILVAGPNFGTGSSREHAVWALVDYGFRAVVSPRIADILRNNATRSGLVPAEVSAEAGRAILDAVERDPSLEVTVDVDRRVVEIAALGFSAPFRLDDVARRRLLEGLDDIGATLEHGGEIDAYEARRERWRLPSLAS